MSTLRVMVLAAVVLCAGAWEARAETCTVGTTSLQFGIYDVFASSPNDSTATIVLSCQGNARDVRIAISRGTAPTFGSRRMWKGSERLFFNVFRDAARTAVWGDGTGGSQVEIVDQVRNNDPYPVTVYGRVPAGQDVSAGSYTDSVTVTIDF
jgi:spore coat protein U-like protein